MGSGGVREERQRTKLIDFNQLPKPLQEAIVAQSRRERALLARHGGQAAFVPSLATYTKADLALLVAAARTNGGLLPMEIRLALMSPEAHPADSRKVPDNTSLPRADQSKFMRNKRKRAR